MADEMDIHATAAQWFAAKRRSGQEPLKLHGGKWDGFEYFSVVVDDVEYWLAEHGLVTPVEPMDR